MSFITLPANQARAEADRAALAAIEQRSLVERAAKRAELFKETAAAEGDGDITRVSLSEGRFIDLAIHKDTFLDDAAIRSDVDASTPLAWKSRYEPVVGVTTGSVYGGGVSTLYATQDNHAFLTPMVVDVQAVKVPTMALTQDPAKLGQREAALRRQAEAVRLKMETFLVNVMTGQPIGTDLATSITAYWAAANSYTSRSTSVYVTDPGVQAGTYETSNLIDCSAEGGLTPAVFDALMTQEILSKRTARTIHIPVAGLPWRKLLRYATIVANSYTPAAGTTTNSHLDAIPAAEWQKMWNMDLGQALAGGLTIQIFGRQYKLKANNALPQGYCIVTTDEPAAEVFNIADRSVSTDLYDPKDPYFVGHYEKRMIAIAQPDPWVRNFFVLNIGNTTGL